MTDKTELFLNIPIVLRQIIISYLDDFNDIDKLLELTNNTKYIFDADIYAEQIYLSSKTPFLLYIIENTRKIHIFEAPLEFSIPP
jgi:hypothetical protein